MELQLRPITYMTFDTTLLVNISQQWEQYPCARRITLTFPSVNAVQPCWQVLPSFLSDTKYANPSQITNTPFQRAHKTEEPAFVWAMSQPQLLQDFNLWMTATHEKQKSWLNVFSMEQFYGQEMSNSTVPLFVDIGGGIGHQCAALRARFPSMKSRVILQDLPFAIEHALPTEGVENTVLDFWGEQPIKGV